MSNSYFQFKQFIVHQQKAAMKVTTDSCLFGAWVSKDICSRQPGAGNLLDIGTGTGLLSLMIAQQSPVTIDAVEIDQDSAIEAEHNIALSEWKQRISVIRSDIRTFQAGKLYDIIVSNPPFYENDLKSVNEQKNAAHHDSTLTMKDLLTVIRSLLKKEGLFYLLLPAKRQTEVIKLIEEMDMSIVRSCMVRQSEQHPFFRVMIAGSQSSPKARAGTEELSIRNNRQEYTPAFSTLLQPYYLYLQAIQKITH